jgi:hypothetical protein
MMNISLPIISKNSELRCTEHNHYDLSLFLYTITLFIQAIRRVIFLFPQLIFQNKKTLYLRIIYQLLQANRYERK